jgi:hypothetical protein
MGLAQVQNFLNYPAYDYLEHALDLGLRSRRLEPASQDRAAPKSSVRCRMRLASVSLPAKLKVRRLKSSWVKSALRASCCCQPSGNTRLAFTEAFAPGVQRLEAVGRSMAA